ncbi:MAG: ABC transporter substrate-binding protein, partial [Ilumatobacteraceae bacterium]
MTRRTSRSIAVLAVAALVAITACGDDDDSADTADTADAADTAPTATEAADGTTPVATDAVADTAGGSASSSAPSEDTGDTEATTAGTGGGGGGSGWAVNTDDCVDPDRANAPIEGTVDIGSAAPLSGGPAATAFAPAIAGMEAYIDFANENDLLPGHDITITYADDKYDPSLTPGAISSALDNGADLISGIVGTPPNLAVRDTLNEECIPQLEAGSGDPAFGEAAEYPWTMGGNLPYDIEAKAYAENVAAEFPDGASAALFYVNNDAGLVFKEAFEEAAGGANIDIVDDQTIEAAETAPPSAQVASIAGNAPDVIVAFPLGAQCPTFLNEIANAKAANSGWEPRVYLTNTCASPLILGAAGPAANGIYTSSPYAAVDVTNPENQSLPGVAEYLSYMESKGLSDTVPTSVAGWVWGQVTVEILRQAAESPEGLTQASIINAARSLDYVPTVGVDGVTYKTSGEEDAYVVEAVQIYQYDAETKFLNA